MNNYINYPKNYNYQTNILPNTSNKTMGNTQSNLYTPYEGFIRGIMFKNIYEPYKQERPYQIQPMNEQAEILTNIDSLGFAMIDLNLYLDVFPDDKTAINLYNQYREQKQQLLDQYQINYGPIELNSNALNMYPWAWNNKPWPWEN